MVDLLDQLQLKTCPHCSVANPVLNRVYEVETLDHSKSERKHWRVYVCTTCGRLVIAWASAFNARVVDVYPEAATVDEDIPERPRVYLQQAIDSIHAPAGSIMLCASSVDAMLKEKGYKDGSLYIRIKEAVNDHLITIDMEQWAHEVRLDANDQRHAEENAELPTEDDARRAIDFVQALAQFLFVLPAKVQRGLANASQASKSS